MRYKTGDRKTHGLTPSRALVLNHIAELIDRNGYAPSVTEICVSLGYTRSVVHGHIVTLEREGFLRRSGPRRVITQVCCPTPLQSYLRPDIAPARD